MARTYLSKNLDGKTIALKGVMVTAGAVDAYKLVSTNINGVIDPSLLAASGAATRNLFIQEEDPGVVTEPVLWVKLNPLIPGDISLVLRIPD